MSKPKVLIHIGHTTLLLPDDTGAATVIKTLSRAVKVTDYSYKGELHLEERQLDLSMSYVSREMKFKGPDGEDLPSRPASARSPKALREPTLRLR